MLNREAAPRPETSAFGFGLPPLIEMPTELFPPPVLLGDSAFPPPEAFDEATPPDMSGFLPSGEIATRAARFPSGTGTTGAGGAGVAESAIKVPVEPAGAFETVGRTSGAATSPCCARAPSLGAEPALISSFGRAGPFCAALR